MVEDPSVPGWCVVVPVKRLARAKTRLLADLPQHLAGGRTREELALAFALDTVCAAMTCPRVVVVVAVTDDARAAVALAGVGAIVVPDVPDAGLNPALRHGAAVAMAGRAGHGVASLSSDLPALRPGELVAALAEAERHERAVVADTEGVGTTLLTARSLAGFAPAYGPGSFRRHASAGAVPLTLALPSLRRDVDSLAHLRAVLRLGAGPRTITIAGGLFEPPSER